LRQHNSNLRKDHRRAFWDDDYLRTAKYQLGFILENQAGTENNTVHSTNNALLHTPQNISLSTDNSSYSYVIASVSLNFTLGTAAVMGAVLYTKSASAGTV
jgi:hypothetical protein